MVKKYYIAMKKKYQIPESYSRAGLLRANLLVGSGANPVPDKPIDGPTPSQGGDEGEARLRKGSNLMEL